MEKRANEEMGAKMEPGERLKNAVLGMESNMRVKGSGKDGTRITEGTANMDEVKRFIDDWPAICKDAAEKTISTYGPPNEAAPSRLTWYNNGVWKRTIVTRDEIVHNFPQPHTDMVENFINYQVPVEKLSEIAKFDGSVIVERTKGEVSARCDMEAANILALNMMNEIVVGNLTAEQAKEKYSEQTAAYVMNRPAPFAEKLMFELSKEKTVDYDKATMEDNLINQIKEKAKDFLEK